MELLLAATASRRPLVALLWRSGLSSEVNDWEGLEWILGDRVFESLLVSGPCGTFKIKTVDADTLSWHREGLLNAAIFTANDFLLDFSLRLDGIKRPLLLGVLSGDFLQGCGQETLWVVESGQPEGDRAGALGEPVIKLEVTVDETLDPATERWRQP